MERNALQLWQGAANIIVTGGIGIQQQEAPAPGPQYFSADRAGGSGPLVPVVYLPIADACGQSPFFLPAGM